MSAIPDEALDLDDDPDDGRGPWIPPCPCCHLGRAQRLLHDAALTVVYLPLIAFTFVAVWIYLPAYGVVGALELLGHLLGRL